LAIRQFVGVIGPRLELQLLPLSIGYIRGSGGANLDISGRSHSAKLLLVGTMWAGPGRGAGPWASKPWTSIGIAFVAKLAHI